MISTPPAAPRLSFKAALAPRLVLHTLYARVCDPVREFLRAKDPHSDEEIAECVVCPCFEGLNAR
jgi:hypothetical protein